MNTTRKGFTIIELLLAIGIIGILITVIVPNLSNYRNEQALTNTTEEIVSLLNKARNDTISSLNYTNYSVHIESEKVVYFTGSTYNASDATNISRVFESSVTIPSSGGINLNGGGSEVLFTRLTGDTTTYGTIIVRLTSNAARQKTITILKTGAISSN